MAPHVDTALAGIDRLCSEHAWGEVGASEFLDRLARLIAEAVGSSRAGIRTLVRTEAGSLLRTVSMFDRDMAGPVRGIPDLGEGVVGTLLRKYSEEGINAFDVADFADSEGCMSDYVSSQKLHSVVDAVICVNGVVLGTLTCERKLGSPRALPSVRPVGVLRQLAARTSACLAKAIDDAGTRPAELAALTGPIMLSEVAMPPLEDTASAMELRRWFSETQNNVI